MSRSNPKQQNPATKFIEWSGSKGEFYFYDKDANRNIEIEMPIFFMFLDELSCVSGYSEDKRQGIFSNEVRNLQHEKLNVRVFKSGTIEIGLWSDIKDRIKTQGGKFCKSVYALMLTNEGTELVNFRFTGSSFGGADDGGGWINVNWNKEKGGIQVKESIKGKKGATVFFSPKFEKVNVREEHDKLAIEADIILQKYLESYFNQEVIEEKDNTNEPAGLESEVKNTYPDLVNDENEPDDLPF